MYQVIIVDDEIWTVKGLTKFIEDIEEFELIYSTTEPAEALEQICLLNPDVVFTDIRMPGMSGIDLMQQIKERGVETEFVVISGFTEFSYAHQAIQEGAVDYLIKPFNKKDVISAFDKLYIKLEKKRDFENYNLFSKLISSKGNIARLLEDKFKSRLYPKLQIAVIHSQSNFDNNLFEMGENSQCFYLKINQGKYLCIINCEEDKTEDIFNKLFVENDKIEKAGISRLGNSIDMFEQLVKDAESAMLDSFIYSGKIFYFRKERKDIIDHIEEIIKELYLNKKYKQLNETITNLRTIFIDKNLCTGDAVYLWNRIVLFLSSIKNNSNKTFDYLDIYGLTEQFTDINEMDAYMNMILVQENLEYSDSGKHNFFEILRYIDLNFAQDISLKELCDKYYFNMSYCCVLFQKYKNMTFSQYLTHVRIEKACELLKDYNISVAETCEMVGYKDYFYFNKVFKKKMGCTPAEYRKNNSI